MSQQPSSLCCNWHLLDAIAFVIGTTQRLLGRIHCHTEVLVDYWRPCHDTWRRKEGNRPQGDRAVELQQSTPPFALLAVGGHPSPTPPPPTPHPPPPLPPPPPSNPKPRGTWRHGGVRGRGALRARCPRLSSIVWKNLPYKRNNPHTTSPLHRLSLPPPLATLNQVGDKCKCWIVASKAVQWTASPLCAQSKVETGCRRRTA